MMGSGEADGADRFVVPSSCRAALIGLAKCCLGLLSVCERALNAAEDALANPLLGDISIKVFACSI